MCWTKNNLGINHIIDCSRVVLQIPKDMAKAHIHVDNSKWHMAKNWT
jgi:hypothetical protein